MSEINHGTWGRRNVGYCSFEWLKAQVYPAEKGLMRPQGTTIHLAGGRLGRPTRGPTRQVASPNSSRRWRDAVAQHAETGLDTKPHPGGSQPKLSLEQRHHLIALWSQGARAHGFRNALWTLARTRWSLHGRR
jgi:hypothetical protein